MRRAFALAALFTAFLAAPAHAAGLDLSTYVRVGRFDLPEPTRTPAPANNLLAKEASAVTYDWDTDTLFVVGDEGTAVTQVSKTGQLIDTMTLAPGAFDDTEGIAYVGGGKFVLSEERERRVDLFTYAPGQTLTRAAVQSVKLGTTVGNIGIEGLTYVRASGDLVLVKELDPEGIFQTGIDWAAGTATNGSATTENAVNLFNPMLAGLPDFSDVYAVDADQLLILSQEAGRIVDVNRSGVVSSSLTIVGDAGNPLSVADQGHEGVTVDDAGRVYVVSENGGGDVAHPQLWVYAPSTAANTAPTAVTLNPADGSIAANASTAMRVKVADVTVADDGIGTNALSVTGPDAASFEVDPTGLYLRAGTALDRASFTVSVAVDDPSVGATPDATSAPFRLTVTTPPAGLVVTEVSPWSSGDSPYGADWFEVTNKGATAVDVTGWKVDDSSNAFASAVALAGVSSIAAGESVIFLEGDAAKVAAFRAFWLLPPGVQVGTYSGSGVGLSTGGDAVNLFTAAGARVTGVTFGAATTFVTFDFNTNGLSVAGLGGAYTVGGATGSPGRIATGTVQVSTDGGVSGLVPPQLSLTLGAPATFGPFLAGSAKDYTATTTATVTSTAGAAALSVADPAAVAPGRLVNGTFALPQALQINANGGGYGALSGAPMELLAYAGPVSGDEVAIGLKQPIGATDALRTGGYAKTLTFTLSTTTP
jgi:uncharacterized protein YjiK